MSEADQIKAQAVQDFVNGLIAAFEAGFVESPVCNLAEVHRMAQHHVDIEYGVKMPHITETWGNDTATACGFNVATGKLERHNAAAPDMYEEHDYDMEELYIDTNLQFDSSINESLLEELTLAALAIDEENGNE